MDEPKPKQFWPNLANAAKVIAIDVGVVGIAVLTVFVALPAGCGLVVRSFRWGAGL